MGLNSSSFLLGIDIGTSSTKACLYTDEGQLVADTLQEYSIHYPKPVWAEENPNDWLNAAFKCIEIVLKKANSADIAGISISGLTPNCVPIDAEGAPVHPAILWIDRRSEAECAWLKSAIGLEKCSKISGNQIDPYFGGPKFLWFRNNRPKLFAKTSKILLGSNYVVYHLTGSTVADHSVAGLCAPCYDYRKKQWSEEICEEMQIPIELLPELHHSQEIIGEITAEASRKTGLKKGTPVVTGGGDFACSTLGVGVIEEGEACEMLGTAGNILMPLNSPALFDIRLLNTSHVVEGKYLTLGSIYSGGVLQWFRNELSKSEQVEAKEKGISAYRLLDQLASGVPLGSDGLIFLPYLMGERTPIWDVYARGVYLGITPYHTKAHLYRAVLEGIGYALNHIVEIVASQISVREIVAVNGGAKSRFWRQIISDIMGIPQIYIAETGGAPLGDAILAGIGCGIFKDAKIVKKWIDKGERTEPIKNNHKTYQKYYELFRKSYEGLKNLFVELFKIVNEKDQ